MKMTGAMAMWGCALALTCQQSFAGILDELSPADQDRVKSGELVTAYPDSGIEGAPWPICKVYVKLAGTPLQGAAVFHDYGAQSTYVPNVAKSEVEQPPVSKTVENVDYVMNLPLHFGTEEYVAQDTLTTYDGGKSFQIAWTVTPTAHIKQSYGSARFEPLGDDATIFAYTSFIYPNRWGAGIGWVVSGAEKQVTDAVTAIVKRIEGEKTSDPTTFATEIETLQKDLAP